MTLAPKGTPLWRTTYGNFAPRLGVAYQLSHRERQPSVLHAGAGTYFDLGTGAIGNTFQQPAFPYFSSRVVTNVSFPLDDSAARPQPLTTAPPYTNLVVADPDLQLPRTYQWSVGIEQTIGSSEVITATYVGAAGRRLLRGEMVSPPNPNFGPLQVVRNAASSDYRSLQIQYRHPLSHGFQAVASYALAHSTDTASNETFKLVPVAVMDPAINRAPSNFDIRHTFSSGITFVTPATGSGPLGGFWRNWSVDALIRARSAAPVDILAAQGLFGVRETTRPDIVAGVPVYVSDPAAPGGIRLNAAAFSSPAFGTQGNLGRNALRGFPVSQADLSIRRRVRVSSSRTLELGADVFNVLNHPNFADPDRYLSDGSAFGLSSSMFGQSVGGLNPVYQLGGPRSVQLSLRVKF